MCGPVKRSVIEMLLADPDPYHVVFGDDGKGEIADGWWRYGSRTAWSRNLVPLQIFRGRYSGGRLADLYEVCGQAQKSARWCDRPGRMLQHMLRREKMRRDRGVSSRIEQGSAAGIKKLKGGWQDHRFEFDVRIV